MTVTSSRLDSGTGYGRAPSSHNARLTEVGPGTPMGEALRRYWHPIACSSALTPEVPHRTKVLGEDLIVFRDGSGRAGVVFERCAHRGSSLYYGRIEEDGIRCCYHGWKFDVQGHCLEQACEPDRGRRRDAARQPWYPVEERYGLVFVYMGPPERKPALPRYDFFENLGDGESFYSELPVPGANVTGPVTPCNWLQTYENGMDQVHATWLHYTHSGPQFDGMGGDGIPLSALDPYKAQETLTWHTSEHGTYYHVLFDKELADGTVVTLDSVAECQLPTVLALHDFAVLPIDKPMDMLIYLVPVDDTSHRTFITTRSTGPDRLFHLIMGIKQNGKFPWELTEEERQRYPGDVEAQVSQGPIAQHSEETLATSDKGVVMLRRMLSQMVDDVEAGRDPINVEFGEGSPRSTKAGLFTVARKDTQAPFSAAANS
ncbi:Rieske 2Fe-2S domain-containing protein [Mycobacterium sp. 1245852.3]|uniref:Rieske 2Fe-2S domain-containing protein n=1 Tax=Mycobacterium sp. 1245852.3 TaxID=1856860 RepID=UPI0008010EF0|nr:Rieske 2Fe-2S domain-containing protein [Mycobacterium sp. 1245852.3]OBJ90434.1 phenoxybenzoate dioxygenase [Mycobacterium sp. 1245852.3]